MYILKLGNIRPESTNERVKQVKNISLAVIVGSPRYLMIHACQKMASTNQFALYILYTSDIQANLMCVCV